MRNIDLKARLRARQQAETVCRALRAVYQGEIAQMDTYFHARAGRLKLRENAPGGMELIYYHRSNAAESKGSDYDIAPASVALRAVLSNALGVSAVVKKVRSLWLWKNVRIHLDDVEELGAFIEFEAVLDEQHDDADGHAKLGELRTAFGIDDDDLVGVGYVDLIRRQ